MNNSVDIVRDFVSELDNRHVTNVQLFGGIGSFALGHSGVEILADEQLIVAPADLYLPQYRDDGNLRDLDCLVKSSLPDVRNEVESIAKSTIAEGQLILSIFGLRPISQLEHQRQHPIASIAKVHVADRYVAENQGAIVAAKKAIFPFAVDLPVATLDTWRLQLGGDSLPLPIPHPGTTVLNYLTRSVSGLRPKDAAKVAKLTRNLAMKAPEIIDWITDGPGQSQFELARVLHSLRQSRHDPQSLDIGGLTIKPYAVNELLLHQAFMLTGRIGLLRGLVEVEHAKSYGLHFLENHEAVVSGWQKHIEPRIQRLLKNEL